MNMGDYPTVFILVYNSQSLFRRQKSAVLVGIMIFLPWNVLVDPLDAVSLPCESDGIDKNFNYEYMIRAYTLYYITDLPLRTHFSTWKVMACIYQTCTFMREF